MDINWLDILLAILGKVFKGESNDGLVGACSSHVGHVIRDSFSMNHLDQINLIAGLHHAQGVDPVVLYLTHLNRLRLLGL